MFEVGDVVFEDAGTYEVAPDGTFYAIRPSLAPFPTQINVVLDWLDVLRAASEGQ